MSQTLDVRGAAFGLGRWVLITADPTSYFTSREDWNPDACTGTAWLEKTLVGDRHALTAVAFAGNQFLAGGTDIHGRLAFARSVEGQTWSWSVASSPFESIHASTHWTHIAKPSASGTSGSSLNAS